MANSSWAPAVLRSVLDLAQSSMPPMDHVKSVNAYTMLSPNVIQEGENWAASVSESFARMKATCKDIAERFEGDAQYEQLRKELSQYSQSLGVFSQHEYYCTEE